MRKEKEMATFTTNYDAIYRMIEHPKEESKNEVEAVRSALKRLDNAVEALSLIQEEHSLIAEEEEISEYNKTIIEIIKRYNELHIKADMFCSTYEHTSDENGGISTRRVGVKLEKIKFEPFDGEIRHYPRFKREFEKHIKPLHQPHEEALVLRTYLSSTIRDGIDSLGDDAGEIWKKLELKYGDEGKLIDTILSEIKFLHPCSIDHPGGTLRMIEILERAQRDLQMLGMEKEISNSTIVSMIENRLPEEINEKWIEIVTGGDRIKVGREKFPALMKLLQQFKDHIQYKMSSMRNTITRGDCINSVGSDSRGRLGKVSWCWLHPGTVDHPIWRCKLFESKTPNERIQLAKNHSSCFAYLAQGHQNKKCTRGFKCRETNCGLNHNTLLHQAYALGTSFHGIGTGNQRNTLLPLQKLMVNGNRQGMKKTQLNCLWDGGSTLSFITHNQASNLNLKGVPINIQIVKIGGTVTNIQSKQYHLPLIDKYNNTMIVNVIGIEKISHSIRAVDMKQVAQIFYSNGLINGQ